MDPNLINLTGIIGANVTLIQPWYAGAISVFGGVILGAFIAGAVEIYRDREKDKREKIDAQIQAYSNLLGCKHALLQYLSAYLLSIIASGSSRPSARLFAISKINFIPVKDDLEGGNFEKVNKYLDEEFMSKYDNSADLKESLYVFSSDLSSLKFAAKCM